MAALRATTTSAVQAAYRMHLQERAEAATGSGFQYGHCEQHDVGPLEVVRASRRNVPHKVVGG